jgi:hypothetical protein
LERLKEKEPKAVLMSLSGLDTKEAWRIRSTLKQKEPQEVLMVLRVWIQNKPRD